MPVTIQFPFKRKNWFHQSNLLSVGLQETVNQWRTEGERIVLLKQRSSNRDSLASTLQIKNNV